MLFFLPAAGLLLLFFIFLLLPVLLFLLPLRIFQAALKRLGVSPAAAVLVFWASLLGSLVNFPLAVRPAAGAAYAALPAAEFFRPVFMPGALPAGTVLAVNLGGALIPLLICAWLARRAPFWPTLLNCLFMTGVCYLVARPVPGTGIVIPTLIPPAAAVVGALVFSFRNRAPVAYIAGVVGVLVGADLMHLGGLPHYEGMMSIGGAGVFDGIFLVGILAALFA